MKILVATEKPFAAAAVTGIREVVEEAGHELVLLEKGTKADLIEKVADAAGLIVRSDIVDKEVFRRDSAPQVAANKPICAVFGKRLKAPDALDAVRYTVEADLREEIRRKWMESLRKKYSVWIDEKILQTVNKH